jgi:hypothetical protein
MLITRVFATAFLCFVLGSASLTYAEQKVAYSYTQAEWRGSASFLEYDCKQYCFKSLSADIKSFLESGWRIVGMMTTETTESPFKGSNTSCRCTGTQYILER